ncbi:tRNA modification GTPase [uncultured Formosa sp.]|uniref:tRNA modification GTPase n=1 Tax=uncultured Formosa sp. TaxID=255435 RepID=UPI002602165E|nr:tRNA modification GTPase [uncultured Formosa sp.]
MKKQLLCLLITILSTLSYSQISFEKGYFIDNSNKKINCLIKNNDWKNNPIQFDYKLSENSEEKNLTLKTVKEFGIFNTSKYIRKTVNLDRSIDITSELTNERNPIFNKEKLFLKVLIEGKANLYSYEDGNLKRYFYNKDNVVIEPLIYKRYKTSNNTIGTYYRFRQQLLVDLKCEDISSSYIEKVDYKASDLVNIFKKYNECNGTEYVNFEQNDKKVLFNLNIRPGLNISSFSTNNNLGSNSRNLDFKNKTGFRFGLEAEFIMPFNKNKWALIIEPTYQYFNAEKKNTYDDLISVDYKSIEIPIGIRHYLFLNDTSKLFINGSFALDFSFNSEIKYTEYNSLDLKSGSRYVVGIGYKYNNIYSAELRYLTGKDMLSNYRSWESYYNTVSIILGYKLF